MAIEAKWPLTYIKTLMENGADPNAKHKEGVTTLMTSVMSSERGIILELLMAQNIFLEITDDKDNSVFHYACSRDSQIMVLSYHFPKENFKNFYIHNFQEKRRW